mmetsp:Transcript_9211/g.24173  ORF Transcript_9211/g.24173 Transcript_9211/m.24173 type:complete len:215 (+) Transcript_9211:488-1132(+)
MSLWAMNIECKYCRACKQSREKVAAVASGSVEPVAAERKTHLSASHSMVVPCSTSSITRYSFPSVSGESKIARSRQQFGWLSFLRIAISLYTLSREVRTFIPCPPPALTKSRCRRKRPLRKTFTAKRSAEDSCSQRRTLANEPSPSSERMWKPLIVLVPSGCLTLLITNVSKMHGAAPAAEGTAGDEAVDAMPPSAMAANISPVSASFLERKRP